MKKIQRKWMYEKFQKGSLQPEYKKGVEEFIGFAKRQKVFQNTKTFRCPCKKCENLVHLDADSVKLCLCKNGFDVDYYDWVCHGEEYPELARENVSGEGAHVEDMVLDSMRAFDVELEIERDDVEEEPNPSTKNFFNMLMAAKKPLYDGSKISVLEIVARITNIKCEYNLPHRCADAITTLIHDIIPGENLMSQSFYHTKKVLKALELPHVKIHVCPNGCMLFRGEDCALDKCRMCGSDRWRVSSKGKRLPKKVMTYFPITPRLQRLYATKTIAQQMTCHHENPRVEGKMAHPSDSEAWKHFDLMNHEFASEPRNVRLGLRTDGSSPFGNFGTSYSCCP